MLGLDFNQIAILLIVTVAAVIDFKTKKLLNVITFPAAVVGIVSNAITGGLSGCLWSIFAWFLGAIIMVYPHPKDKLGFGDAKMMAAIGAFLGPVGLLVTILYFSIFYGMVSIWRVASVIPWKQFFDIFFKFGGNVAVLKNDIDTEKILTMMKSKIALGPLIALGLYCCVFLEKQTLSFLGFH
jgi:prepilin peptidase CpaA